jgi:hypothetical protein
MNWGSSLTHVLVLLAQSSNAAQLVNKCKNLPFPNVVCVDRYGTSIPGIFNRGALDVYPSTSVTDKSFSAMENASFIVFDHDKGRDILGSHPSVQNMFTIEGDGTDAPA